MPEGIITIKKGREKPILNQHPWIFSGAIARAENAVDGELVTVVDHKNQFLARGYWNSKSQIQVRILTWQDEPINDEWWYKMLKRSILARLVNQKLHRGFVTGFRLVNAENDFLPGLVVDYYNGWFVLQALTLGIDTRKHKIAELIHDVWKEIYVEIEGVPDIFKDRYKGVYERSDVDIRRHEGLSDSVGILAGKDPPTKSIEITEEGIAYYTDIINGHKTGFYLDQRANRRLLRDFIGNDFTLSNDERKILNLFSYTGLMSVASLDGILPLSCFVTNVDSSFEALQIAETNVKTYFETRQTTHNYENHSEFIQADAFDYLHHCVEENKQFDIVILDPPKFAHNKRQIDRASRGYKNLNMNAFKIIKEGGYLMTFSCSGAISRELFQKIVFGALADSGRQAQIIKHLFASDDHPVALTFPEGEYLKGLLLRVY